MVQIETALLLDTFLPNMFCLLDICLPNMFMDLFSLLDVCLPNMLKLFIVLFSLPDICLPAVFMPSKVGHIYHPSASNYFHPTGISDGGGRIGQPPTLIDLPPLQLNK